MKNLIHKTIFLIIPALILGIAFSAAGIAQNSSDPNQIVTIKKSTSDSKIPEIIDSINQPSIKRELVGPDISVSKRNENYWDRISSFVNTFSTAILALLTCIYVILTYHILKEMREAREPAIEIDFEVSGNIHKEVFMWIKNAGQSPAKNIQIGVDEKLPLTHVYELKEVSLKEASIFKNSIPYLAPGRSKKHVVGNLRLNREIWKAEDYIVNFTVNFENMKAKKQTVSLAVDVLQCIDPMVFRGEECASPGAAYQVKMNKEP